MDALLTERAAALLCLSIRSLQRLRQSGAGPKFVRLGGAVRYRQGDLEGYVAGRVVTSTSAILKKDNRL
jgi:hypothetical protein